MEFCGQWLFHAIFVDDGSVLNFPEANVFRRKPFLNRFKCRVVIVGNTKEQNLGVEFYELARWAFHAAWGDRVSFGQLFCISTQGTNGLGEMMAAIGGALAKRFRDSSQFRRRVPHVENGSILSQRVCSLGIATVPSCPTTSISELTTVLAPPSTYPKRLNDEWQ